MTRLQGRLWAKTRNTWSSWGLMHSPGPSDRSNRLHRRTLLEWAQVLALARALELALVLALVRALELAQAMDLGYQRC